MTETLRLRPFFPSARDFAAAASPHFEFLVSDLGFGQPKVSDEPGGGFDIRFDSDSVNVLRSWESDGGSFGCQLVPLTHGGRLEPDVERWLSPTEILAAGGVLDEWPNQRDFDDVTHRRYGALMERAATCLREHCADVLAGDWSVYDAAHRWLEKGVAS